MSQAIINNENDYKLARSKLQQEKQSSQSQQPQPNSIPTIASQESGSSSSVSQPTRDSEPQTIAVPQRQYLGDVSNQYITVEDQQSSTQSQTIQTNLIKRKQPLGVSQQQQQQQPQQQHLLHKIPKSIPIASDTIANLAVPARIPQKRQATESSTNLVEKLKIPDAVAADNVDNINKKTRLIDYEWQDLDEDELDDPLMASEYANDIFTYFADLESRMLPDPQYLYKQKHLKPKMRSILVDWLVEMHLKFRLLPETLFLAINIMDRFMSIEIVQIDKLQLLATASLFIAAKYEEVFSPSIKNYAYFTDGAYVEEEILQAEKYVLTILNFDLNYPNPMNFLRRISKADEYDVQSRTLGKYLLEITIIDHKFIGMKPSLCCASAMYLARLIMEKTPVWNGNLIHYSGGYRLLDLKPCVELIFQYLISPVEHDEFFKKYATKKFMKASILCRSWAKKFYAEGKSLMYESKSTHRISMEQ
ncbi:CLB2 [[Candida] subhashii]|uniref:CLB2 n=1 Tax=[Candida] subhashii TaxID=561895 RepID=A0A8J5UGU7_9ASCO|nr:CLB2 [[Candida] subhashii]KAG7662718.1 CLB2 [[Candida] subhashii]